MPFGVLIGHVLQQDIAALRAGLEGHLRVEVALVNGWVLKRHLRADLRRFIGGFAILPAPGCVAQDGRLEADSAVFAAHAAFDFLYGMEDAVEINAVVFVG